MLIVDHGGGLYRLVRAAQESAPSPFPVRLSDTGLFLSTKDHQPDPALIPYSVNADGWIDGAKAQRWIALPGESRIEYTSSGGWNFPDGSVVVQTLSLESEVGNPASSRRVETRLLTRQKGEWAGYSYKWDETQTDAVLVPSRGEERELIVRDPAAGNGTRAQPWRYPSRSECMACHSRAANYVLGLTELQMNKVHRYEAASDNQLRTLQHLGVLNKPPRKTPAELPKLANPYDETQALDSRARSYLHANCSVCHVEAGGSNSQMELKFTTRLERMKILEARPQHDTFGIDNAMLVAPGDPDRSILFQRLSRRGRGQMPPLVSARVDEKAVALFREWIRQMTPQQKFVRDWKAEDLLVLLPQVKAGRSLESGRNAFRQSGCSQCHRFDGAGGSVGPDLTGLSKRLSLHQILEAVIDPSKTIGDGYASAEIELNSGENLTGRIEREDEQTVVIRTLAAPETPMTLSKREIARRAVSKVSNMPTGTLNTLEEKQILDLFAFLMADGDPNHSVFQSDGAGK